MSRLPQVNPQPDTVFGFVFLGGSVTGAQVHEVRLANELHHRGFPVHVWRAVDKPDHSPLAAGIPERWLFHSFRYATGRVSSTLDLIGKLTNSLMNERWRAAFSQRIPWMVAGTLRGMIKMVCDGVTADQRLIRRFARELTAARVTHTLQTIELLAPFVEASRAHMAHPVEYMVQFQGYETYAPYASIHSEPFGMVPVEAMAQGTPVVVPDTGGVSQLPFLNDQQAGLLFRSWDSEDLAAQLELMLANQALHKQFSTAAPKIAAHYSVERLADRILDLFGLPHDPNSMAPT